MKLRTIVMVVVVCMLIAVPTMGERLKLIPSEKNLVVEGGVFVVDKDGYAKVALTTNTSGNGVAVFGDSGEVEILLLVGETSVQILILDEDGNVEWSETISRREKK